MSRGQVFQLFLICFSHYIPVHMLGSRETKIRLISNRKKAYQEMATHSSILAWRIPWTEEPGGLQCMGSQELDTTERLSTLTIVKIQCCECIFNVKQGADLKAGQGPEGRGGTYTSYWGGERVGNIRAAS